MKKHYMENITINQVGAICSIHSPEAQGGKLWVYVISYG